MYFSGVVGLGSDGSTFKKPAAYTPNLSALVYYCRLIFLETQLPRTSHEHIGLAARPRYNQLGKLQAAQRRTMCLGSQAPVGELLSLRSYGRAAG